MIDANGCDIDLDQTKAMIQHIPYDVLVFRFTPTTFDNDMMIAAISKSINPKRHTVGICWTLRTLPRQVLQEAPDLDYYVMHEYESVTPALVQSLSSASSLSTIDGVAYRENGEIKVNRDAHPTTDWDTIPLPRFDLIPSLKPYQINTPHGKPFVIMYTSKGCPYSCTFCTVRRTSYKKRSAESILNELRYLKKSFGVRTVSFFDETFTIDRKRTMALCEAIKQENLHIRWYCNTRVELVDRILLSKMREAGCSGIAYGIESGSQRILDDVEKGNTVEEAENAIRWTKQAGIKAYCSFIVGLPGESWETVEETLRFIVRTRPTGAQFNVAVPYPGTPMYDLAVKKGWVGPSLDWRQLRQDTASMQTDSLTLSDLEEARRMAYRALYFNPRWILNNIFWVLRHPEDFYLGVRYFMKAMNNYVVHGMRHAH